MGSDVLGVALSDVELLTSEVVSNAVKHGNLDPRQEIRVRIVMDGHIRVEVMDPGPPFEADLSDSPGSSGWGLFVVDTISASWGVEPDGVGKRVWFEIAAA
jgi:anti-sigma regulatory factor (Ser/Thr protein kinase)